MDSHRHALLAEAARHRETALMLERSAQQNERLANLARGRGTEAVESLMADAKAMQTQAAIHRNLASQAEWKAGPEYRPSAQVSKEHDAEIGPILTTAAVAALTVLPMGLTVGAAALTAAPYLGIDPDGTARRHVCAVLKRDSDGRFGLLLKEDERGIFIATLLETDVSDERAVLRVGDRLRALNGDLVRATEQEAEQAAAGEPNAQRPTSAPTLQAAGTPASAPLSLDDAKQLVRSADESITVEVFRREVRPAAERLLECKDRVMGDAQRVLDLAKSNPNLGPHLERASDGYDQHIKPYLERVGQQVQESASVAQQHVQRTVGHWQQEGEEQKQVAPLEQRRRLGLESGPSAGAQGSEAGADEQRSPERQASSAYVPQLIDLDSSSPERQASSAYLPELTDVFSPQPLPPLQPCMLPLFEPPFQAPCVRLALQVKPQNGRRVACHLSVIKQNLVTLSLSELDMLG